MKPLVKVRHGWVGRWVGLGLMLALAIWIAWPSISRAEMDDQDQDSPRVVYAPDQGDDQGDDRAQPLDVAPTSNTNFRDRALGRVAIGRVSSFSIAIGISQIESSSGSLVEIASPWFGLGRFNLRLSKLGSNISTVPPGAADQERLRYDVYRLAWVTALFTTANLRPYVILAPTLAFADERITTATPFGLQIATGLEVYGAVAKRGALFFEIGDLIFKPRADNLPTHPFFATGITVAAGARVYW